MRNQNRSGGAGRGVGESKGSLSGRLKRAGLQEKKMETHFQQELNQLKAELLRMAGLVERAINNAVEALVHRNTSLAERTIAEDNQINEIELGIDEQCLELLALHQPMAADLRFITSAMRINTDLERIGDQAVNIAERVIALNREPQLKPYIDIPRMAEITQSMVKDVLDAFVNGDAQLARSVCERDDQVDALNDQVFRELLTYMISDPQTITRSVHLILVSRCLERIADHATNIAEGVIFMVKALVIKHGADKKEDVSPP
jgi:phosphate transport system protein